MSQITLRSKRRYGKDYREVVLDPSIPSDVKRRDTLLAAGWEVIHGAKPKTAAKSETKESIMDELKELGVEFSDTATFEMLRDLRDRHLEENPKAKGTRKAEPVKKPETPKKQEPAKKPDSKEDKAEEKKDAPPKE
jgi:ribosomal protein L12E/L44/L45/RPP1/RPP2